jgi:Methyltransferase domain
MPPRKPHKRHSTERHAAASKRTADIAPSCRLCGGLVAPAFRKHVLRRHDVAFFRCGACGSVQTETPFWLDEAYAIPGVHVDVGIASRTIKNWVALAALFELIGLDRDALVVDFGGASGLLARLLRDVGYNAQSYDKYSTPAFTSYFNAAHPRLSKPNIVTAFEVFEHFVDPNAEISALLAGAPDMVLFTTWFCDGQADDWIYYAEDCGQHVFFYAQQAMRDFAGSKGYELVLTSYFHVLVRRDANQQMQDGLQTFQREAQRLAHEAARPLFERIALGNSYMEADYKRAEAWFKADLDKARDE